MSDFNTALENKIEDFYQKIYVPQSGLDYGWRLFASPSDTIENAQVVLIDQNPSGKEKTQHDGFCVDAEKNAYIDESWNNKPAGKAPLQIQIQKLFEMLGCKPQDVLTGHIFPFRSPDWKKFNKEKCLAFSRNIWREILSQSKPKSRLIIALGNESFDQLKRILDIKENDIEDKIYLNWTKTPGRNNVSGKKARFSGGTLIGLPLLSQYSIMTRPRCQEPLRQLFKEFLPDKVTV